MPILLEIDDLGDNIMVVVKKGGFSQTFLISRTSISDDSDEHIVTSIFKHLVAIGRSPIYSHLVNSVIEEINSCGGNFLFNGVQYRLNPLDKDEIVWRGRTYTIDC